MQDVAHAVASTPQVHAIAPEPGGSIAARRNATSRRIDFLDGVRGVAAFVVMAQHFAERYSEAYLNWSVTYLNFGRIGVVTFFIVSGYVIPLSLSSQDLRLFATRRFFRLYPIYWIAMLSAVAVEWERLGKLDALTPTTLFMNATMLHGLIGMISILSVSWTLGIELFYYVQSGSASAVKMLHRSVYLGWFWLAAYAAAAIVGWLRQVDLPTTPLLLLFTASLGHALHLRDSRGSREWRPLLAAGVIVVPLLGWPALSTQAPAAWTWHPVAYGLSFVAGVLLFFAFYALRDLRMLPVLVWLGTISYSVYLFHGVVNSALSHWFSGVLLVVVATAAVLLLSHVAYHLVEKPSIQLGRRLSTAKAR